MCHIILIHGGSPPMVAMSKKGALDGKSLRTTSLKMLVH